MLIETTINSNTSTRLVLERAVGLSGLPVSVLIMMLLRRIMMERKMHTYALRPVRYQRGDRESIWCRVHINLSFRDYEYLLDLRKFYKMSVSLLIAIAVNLYLDSVLAEFLLKNTNKTDNYTFQNYILIQEVYGSVICWKIYWGLPENLGLLYPQEDP
ncbi:MAG: hypothetical protein JXA20_08475 [Spirochaetes bacterium]|nr:hypothetical protein [Spirochaetota bacterium]